MKLRRLVLLLLGGGTLFFVPILSASANSPDLFGPRGSTQCSDHVDNDNDGDVDFSGLTVGSGPTFPLNDPDADCSGAEDDSEAPETTPPTDGDGDGGGTTPTNNTSSSDSTATNTNTNTDTNTNTNDSSSDSTSSGTSSSGSSSESCVALCDSVVL